jgi:hypothetical protein
MSTSGVASIEAREALVPLKLNVENAPVEIIELKNHLVSNCFERLAFLGVELKHFF